MRTETKKLLEENIGENPPDLDLCNDFLGMMHRQPKQKLTSGSTSKNPNNLILKWAKVLSGHFSKKGIQMANMYIKRCSTLPVMRKIQIKTTVSYHLIPVRIAIFKKTKDIVELTMSDVVGREDRCFKKYES